MERQSLFYPANDRQPSGYIPRGLDPVEMMRFTNKVLKRIGLPSSFVKATKDIVEAYRSTADGIGTEEFNFHVANNKIKSLQLPEPAVIGAAVVAAQVVLEFNDTRKVDPSSVERVEQIINDLTPAEGSDVWKKAVGVRSWNLISRPEPGSSSEPLAKDILSVKVRIGDIKLEDLMVEVASQIEGLRGKYKIKGRVATDDQLDRLGRVVIRLLQGEELKRSDVIRWGLDPDEVHKKAKLCISLCGSTLSDKRFHAESA
jgi:hypothetical protein